VSIEGNTFSELINYKPENKNKKPCFGTQTAYQEKT
jgi:hypothetical protein